MMAASISMLPTIVYRKNLYAALIFSTPPQTPIMTIIGTSIISQNTKNRKRSRETKQPSIAPCSIKNAKHRSLMRCWMALNDTYSAMGVLNVHSRTSHMLTPSTATW